jgi:ABC-type multidrug transport system ATPase subunit
MYARLGFSVAAHVDPEVLLIDEVLSVGDFPFQAKCLQRMKETMNKGTTIVYISHNIPSVIEICPQAILLSRGEIQKFGASADVSRFYYRAYGEMHRADTLIRLDQIELLSAQATPCCSFDASAWATLRVTATSAETVREVAMSFFIKRSDGLILFDASSDTTANKRYSFEPRQTRLITVDFRINLQRGTYFLGVNFWNPEKGLFYMYQDEAIEFHVQAPLAGGCTFVDTRWQ